MHLPSDIRDHARIIAGMNRFDGLDAKNVTVRTERSGSNPHTVVGDVPAVVVPLDLDRPIALGHVAKQLSALAGIHRPDEAKGVYHR